jgi:hypothetical protein
MESPFEFMEHRASLTRLTPPRPRGSQRKGLNGYSAPGGCELRHASDEGPFAARKSGWDAPRGAGRVSQSSSKREERGCLHCEPPPRADGYERPARRPRLRARHHRRLAATTSCAWFRASRRWSRSRLARPRAQTCPFKTPNCPDSWRNQSLRHRGCSVTAVEIAAPPIAPRGVAPPRPPGMRRRTPPVATRWDAVPVVFRNSSR